MRYFWIIFLTTSLYAVQPILNDYGTPENVFVEMRNITDNAQDKGFRQVNSTPAVSEFVDGERVLYVSSPSFSISDVHEILRIGTTLYYGQNFKLMTGR